MCDDVGRSFVLCDFRVVFPGWCVHCVWFKDPKTLTPEEELRREFPGITDDLIKNILADDNPQRIAEVKATLHEAMKMQENLERILELSYRAFQLKRLLKLMTVL